MSKNCAKRRLCTVALGIALTGLLPLTGHAKDGNDDDRSHGLTVAAAGCTELTGVPGAPSARVGGAFTVPGGATASLVCPIPADELGHSSGSSAKPVSFQVAYLDSDGPGAALVAVELVQTTLAADPDGFNDTVVCAWNSAAGGPVIGATASFACNGLVEGAFYHLRVGLASTPGSAASFVGVVAHR